MDFKEFFNTTLSKGDDMSLVLSDSRVINLNSRGYDTTSLDSRFILEDFVMVGQDNESKEFMLININQIIQINITNNQS